MSGLVTIDSSKSNNVTGSQINMKLRNAFLGGLLLTAIGCQTAQQAREIKMVGFEEDASKGKGGAPIEGSDCVYQVLGYWLSGQPTLSKAMMNARKGRSGSISDSVGGEEGSGSGDIRYLNNVSVSNDGFNAVVFGKTCIKITATGFK